MNRYLSLFLGGFFCLFLTGYQSINRSPITIKQLLDKTFTSIDKVQTLAFTLTNTERINGELLTGKQYIEFSASPRKCYVLLMAPNPGAELLFVAGKNNNEAIYNPNGFPYFHINLDPEGFIMRRNNHHTLFEMGFTYMGDLIRDFYNKAPSSFILTGEKQWNNEPYYELLINNPDFQKVKYTVGEKENVVAIARKKNISEYLILEYNEEIDDYNDVEPGQQITIPSGYARKVELLIDKKTHLPLFQKIYDDKGLYEQYEYEQLKYNPVFTEMTFSEERLGKILNW